MIHPSFTDNINMNQRKLYLILAFCLLCFSLVTQPLFVEANSKQRQSVQQLHPNNTSALSESETEVGSPSCTDDCIHPQTSDQKTTSEIQNIIQVALPKEACELLSSKHQLKDGKLTDYWAQEMIGADLLKEEIEKAPPLPEDKFLVAVFDSPSNDHNIHVQNLISHDGEQAVLPKLNDSQIQFFQTSGSSQYMDVVEELQKFTIRQNRGNTESSLESTVESISKQAPSFINNSMNWNESQTIYNAISRIHPPAILVTATGNSYPLPLDPQKSQFSKEFDGILVGSLSPSGLVSDFSQEGEEVHILAPSDNWITSVGNDGKYKKFGGTSGAAPLVTGSLAGFEWLSSYHPTPAEAKLLLEQTGIPTIHSEFEAPQKNGMDMLNAYKLGMVAKRLKEKCKKNEECFQREIRNEANYEFPIDETSILEQVKNAFPECSDQEETQTTCEDKKAAFKKLRQALLLDVDNVSLLEKLHCIYKGEGFPENALNVEMTIAAVTKDEAQISKILKGLAQNPDKRVRRLVARGAGTIGGSEGTEILKGFMQDSDPEVRKHVTSVAGRIGGKEGVEILKGFMQDPDPQVREAAARGFGTIGNKESIKMLKELAQNPDVYIRKGVAQAAGRIGGKEGVEVLKSFIQDFYPDVRREVALAAGRIGGKEGVEILKGFMQDPAPQVREAAARGFGTIGNKESIKMLKELAQNPDVYIRKGVAQAAGRIGGKEGVEILKGFMQDSDPDVRIRVTLAARRIGGKEGAEVLKGFMQDSDPDVRKYVAYTAGRIGGKEGAEVLKGFMQDSDPDVRREVALAAGRIGGKEGAEVLKGFMQDSDPDVRKYVALATRRIGGKKGAEVLKGFIQDSDPDVRIKVTLAAGRIGGKEGAEVLKGFMQDSDPDVRKEVAYTAGTIGGKEGAEVLKGFMQDSDPDVRKYVAYTAGRIGGKEGAEVLKGFMQDSDPDVRIKVTLAAGRIGGKEGIEILRALELDSDPKVREAVAYYLQILQ